MCLHQQLQFDRTVWETMVSDLVALAPSDFFCPTSLWWLFMRIMAIISKQNKKLEYHHFNNQELSFDEVNALDIPPNF